MKKIMFLGAFIAMSMLSCSKDNGATPVVKPVAKVETSSITMDLKTVGSGAKTSKTVNGGLYAWINEIDITTKSNDFVYAPFLTPFFMTADAIGTVETNGDVVVGSYSINNVALGSNDFTVITKCNTPQLMVFENTTQTPADRMTTLKTKNPYAIYGASILGAVVVHGANVLPPTTLTTTQGRACAVFTINPALTSLGVTAKVSAAPSVPLSQSLPTLPVNGNTNCSLYWSNVNSIGGTSVLYTVQLYDNNGHLFNTFTATMNLSNSTSTNIIYTINESDITTNTEMDLFTAQTWINGEPVNTTIGN